MRNSRRNSALTKMKMANPISNEVLSGWCQEPAGRRLLEETLTSSVDAKPSFLLSRRRTGRRMTLALAALCLSIGMVVSLQRQPEQPADGRLDHQSSALESLVRTASERPVQNTSGANVQYTATKVANVQLTGGAHPFTVVLNSVRETWVMPDGSGLSRTRLTSWDFPSSADRLAWEASGRPIFDSGRIEERRYEAGQMEVHEYGGLSSDVDTLFDQIKLRAADSGPGLDAEMFIVIGDILRAVNVPPDLRASLFRVAARIPGVTVTDGAKDPEGRVGISAALVYDDQNGSRMELRRVFNPETTELMSETQAVVEKTTFQPDTRPPGAPASVRGSLNPPTLETPPGTVVSSTVYLRLGFVGALGLTDTK